MSSPSSNTEPLIGYCHQCNQQVEIDPDLFTCRSCNGGFIELFEMDQSNQASEQGNERVRIESMQLNADAFPNLLPFLQLINPSLRLQPSQNQPSNESETAQTQTQAQPNIRQGPTRFQFIVPNRTGETGQEQFDLYGIINNVINDILVGGRPPGGGQTTHFHFQTPPMRMFQLHGDLRDYAWGANGLDSIITQLLNQLENTGPPPASDDQLKNIPLVTITQQDVDKNVQCAICMEDFNLNDQAKKLPCKHFFHEPCIVEWLKLHGTCPVCRKNLNGEDTSQREYISRPPGLSSDANSNNEATSSNINTTPTINNNNSSSNTNNSSMHSNNQGVESNSNSNNQNRFYEPDFD